MDLIRELQAIRDSPPRETNYIKPLFWRLLDVVLEMAKGIEALEGRETARLQRAIGADKYVHYGHDQG